MRFELDPKAETILRQEAAREGMSIDDLIFRTFSAEQQSNGAVPSAHRISALGKYAGVLSSEEFMRRKQDEIDLEDRQR